jgi:hypothetical protein
MQKEAKDNFLAKINEGLPAALCPLPLSFSSASLAVGRQLTAFRGDGPLAHYCGGLGGETRYTLATMSEDAYNIPQLQKLSLEACWGGGLTPNPQAQRTGWLGRTSSRSTAGAPRRM